MDMTENKDNNSKKKSKSILRRFKTCYCFGSVKDDSYKITHHCESGDYIVDDSHFIPMSEAVKSLSNSQPFSGAVVDAYYDFPDGRDTGFSVPVDRLHPSLVETSVAVREETKKIKKALDREKARRADLAYIESLNSSKVPDTAVNPSSGSSGSTK